jgi:uncharacterized membrane protein
MAVAAIAAAGLPACATVGGGKPGAFRAVSFRDDVQPIFDEKCVSCHPTAYPYLDLHAGRSYAQLVGQSPPNAVSYERVVAGRPDLSYLLLHPVDPSRRGLLTRSDRRLIAAWIRQGAKNN